jgi:hypothetical protein
LYVRTQISRKVDRQVTYEMQNGVATDMTDPVHIDSFLSQFNKCVGSTLL